MTPKISVVMPTHNRGGLLAKTLLALNSQTTPSAEYELVLVADGCIDNTSEVVAQTKPQLQYNLCFIEQPGQGAATARNNGVARATAPLILFLDDDMDPHPTLIEAHIREHLHYPGSLVLGYFPIPAEPTLRDPFARAAREWWDAGFAKRRQPNYRFTFKDFCTGNISLSKALFCSVGGFYQRIKSAGGEDYELGVRLLKMGARFRFAADAISLHQDFNSLDRALRRSRAEGLAHVLLVQRHVELAWSFNLHRLSRLQAFPFGAIWRLLWRRPRIADFGAAGLKAVVVTAQRLGLESVMWRLYPGLAGHAYWRGVREGLGSVTAWERLMQDSPLEPQNPAEIDINVATDCTNLAAILDQQPADSVRFWWNGAPLGRMHPVPGAERLSETHVREEILSRYSGLLIGKLVQRQFDNLNAY